MDGSVRVLLVSAGASPDALVAELERLGVEITPCSFVDAEEHLETDPPDLVALAGALGAVELANMIDDLEDGPRMVIVAERKELAKLRGLNREVVVSLFAMETTEKVVGQRIESLARRAARRRDHKAAEPALVKKTSLGLPTAAQVGKLEIKKGEAPPRSRGPAISEQGPPPSSGKHSGSDPEPFQAPEPPPVEPPPIQASVPEPSSPEPRKMPEVRAAESAAKGPPPPKASKIGGVDPAKAVSTTGAQKPQLPERPSPLRSAKEEAERSIMVIDEDLLESILPDPPEENIPELSILSMISIAPDPEDAPVSYPPTLPPAAKAQSSGALTLKLAAAPGELDIADAEDALANIDSVKLEITQDLVEHAQKEMGGAKPMPQESEESRVDASSSPDSAETAPEMEAHAARVTASQLGEPSSLGMDQTIAFSDLKASFGEFGDDEPTKVADVEEERVAGAEVEVHETKSAKVSAPETQLSVASAPRRKGSGAGAFGIVAVVGAGLVGLIGVQSGWFGEKPLGDVPEAKNATATAAPAQPEAAKEAESEGEMKPTEAPPEPSAASPSTDAPSTEAAPDAPPDGRVPLAPAGGDLLDNPFKRDDAKASTCEELLKGSAPVKGSDPVSEASAVWDKARAAIVGGKLQEAHLHMCQAVAINPESAAVEGLAAHYLSLGSYAEAQRWANQAEALRPGQKDIGNLMGDVYAMMGEVEKARDTWLNLLNIKADESSRLAPISKDYSVEAGRHLRRGDLIRAEIFFRRAVILDPENLNGIIGLAKVYHRMGMPDYARAFCYMSLKLSDVIPEVHVLLGELALTEGNKEEARSRFERALAVRPDFFPAKRGLSQVK